jgi:hypothetical protein
VRFFPGYSKLLAAVILALDWLKSRRRLPGFCRRMIAILPEVDARIPWAWDFWNSGHKPIIHQDPKAAEYLGGI